MPALEPLTEATEILGKEDFPSLGSIYPLVIGLLKNQLATNALDTALIKEFKCKVAENIQERYHLTKDATLEEGACCTLPVLASALDPRLFVSHYVPLFYNDYIIIKKLIVHSSD